MNVFEAQIKNKLLKEIKKYETNYQWKMYNTETAKHVGHYANGLGWNNFRNLKEDLYLKKTGEFFLAGEGGPLTKYVEDTGFGKTAGYGIFPLSEEEARKWVEEYLPVHKYIELFGEPEE